MTHDAPGHPSRPCQRLSHGYCRTCELIDRDGPHYREDYRRLYFPGEFPASAPLPPPVVLPEVSPRGPGDTDDMTTARPATTPTAPPSAYLAGDVVEAMTRIMGADRLATWVAKKLGKNDCGCKARRDKLNALDHTARSYLKRFTGRSSVDE